MSKQIESQFITPELALANDIQLNDIQLIGRLVEFSDRSGVIRCGYPTHRLAYAYVFCINTLDEIEYPYVHIAAIRRTCEISNNPRWG